MRSCDPITKYVGLAAASLIEMRGSELKRPWPLGAPSQKHQQIEGSDYLWRRWGSLLLPSPADISPGLLVSRRLWLASLEKKLLLREANVDFVLKAFQGHKSLRNPI